MGRVATAVGTPNWGLTVGSASTLSARATAIDGVATQPRVLPSQVVRARTGSPKDCSSCRAAFTARRASSGGPRLRPESAPVTRSSSPAHRVSLKTVASAKTLVPVESRSGSPVIAQRRPSGPTLPRVAKRRVSETGLLVKIRDLPPRRELDGRLVFSSCWRLVQSQNLLASVTL
mmetsp:Transcript_94612/g.181742  ORF Transcript_94612/g.181742 Transcript_94612/m.181742 type:complete len:175 (-) Transcript_94612:33-557(-)